MVKFQNFNIHGFETFLINLMCKVQVFEFLMEMALMGCQKCLENVRK